MPVMIPHFIGGERIANSGSRTAAVYNQIGIRVDARKAPRENLDGELISVRLSCRSTPFLGLFDEALNRVLRQPFFNARFGLGSRPQ